MVKLTELKKVKTYKDLEKLGIGKIYCDISHRGGGIGFWSNDIAKSFKVNEGDLPRKFGAGCNYLGGGIRGSIFPSNFSNRITGKKAKLLSALALACVRVYENLEDESGLNGEKYPDGDTNWESKATKEARKNRAISAY
jgi:hypothetical protein